MAKSAWKIVIGFRNLRRVIKQNLRNIVMSSQALVPRMLGRCNLDIPMSDLLFMVLVGALESAMS